ncbi:hypothetical protein SC499_25635 [Peribacillus simplex]|uniref:hypothetical protein n=1 Tax=Peribacillus simplex TaxID=1478 RepID=UPI00298DD012|nr:hypothetical protein [Peribacillus simplex]MDW7617944.1 hypothetical protein [Peribacillus simplex]
MAEEYITYFVSNNNRIVEFHRTGNSGLKFAVYLNNKKVAVTYKSLAIEWLRALVKPEQHQNKDRLFEEVNRQ